MFQRSAAQLLAPAIRNAVQRRCESVISSPPTQKVSTAEKIILGGGMCCATLVIPGWVLVHMKEYRGLK